MSLLFGHDSSNLHPERAGLLVGNQQPKRLYVFEHQRRRLDDRAAKARGEIRRNKMQFGPVTRRDEAGPVLRGQRCCRGF